MTHTRNQFIEPTREDDERLLEWLRLRSLGHSPRQIADALGTTRNAVLGATRRVLVRDIEQSGEPEGVVRAGYWSDAKVSA